MASENTIYFYPGQGGHSHDGENSSFIDTSKYSLFDFSWGFLGDPDRRSSQATSYNSFQNFIVETVNNAVLKPAGLILQPGTVNGDSDIIANSITTNLIAANAITTNEIAANAITANQIAANTITAGQIAANTITANQIAANTITASEIAANTITASEIAANTITAAQIATDAITADEIAAGTITASEIAANTITAAQIAAGAITADELSANIVLVNNVISSSNYSPGVSGWAINGNGNAEFSSASIRGAIDADSVSTTGLTIHANGEITTSSGNFGVSSSGVLSATGASISGTITTGSLTGDLNLTNTGQVLGPGQVNVYGVMANIVIANDELTIGASRGIKSLGNFSTTSSSTTARIHSPGSGGEIIRGPSSLRELKYNIQNINNALDILNQIRPRQYNWHIDGIDKLDPTTNEPWSDEAKAIADLSISYGFIAEEIGEDYPALTVYKSPSLDLPKDQPGGYYDLNAWTPAMWKEMDMIPLLVKAVQEFSEKVQSLEARLTEIEG